MAEYELKSFSFEVFVSVYNNNLTKILKSRYPVHPKKLIWIKNNNNKLANETLSFFFFFFFFFAVCNIVVKTFKIKMFAIKKGKR